ncbi:UPF0149 family protein [Pseudomonadota bacterium]
MDKSPTNLNYDQTDRRLAKAGIDSSLAEVHGLLCGLLCAAQGDVRQRWLSELISEQEADSPAMQACSQSLVELYNHSLSALQDPELGFTPLLPDEEQPLQQRTEGLVEWCQSFLYGIGLSGAKLDKELSDQGHEAIRDMTEITHLDTGSMEESEDDEQALFELEEFIRVAVLMLREELAASRERRHDLH